MSIFDAYGVSNFSLVEFTRRTLIAGHLSFKGILLLPVYYLQIIPTIPFLIVQNVLFAKRIEKTEVTSNPIFILGHFRSGTTLIHKYLISDYRFGFLTYYDSLFPNTSLIFGKKVVKYIQFIANIFRIKNPFFHDNIIKLTEPDEEDDYLMNKISPYSAYWGIIFPCHWEQWLNSGSQLTEIDYINGWMKAYQKIIRVITYKCHGKQLILKSPPNTGRLRLLLTMYPDSKFIFIRRNPYEVYYSTLNMWKRAILKYYSVQKISEEKLDEIIFGHYRHLMECYDRDKCLIKHGNLTEVSYEELRANPFSTIERIYTKLQIPDFQLAIKSLSDRIDHEKKYTTFHHNFSPEKLETIRMQWATYIDRWGYQKPAIQQ